MVGAATARCSIVRTLAADSLPQGGVSVVLLLQTAPRGLEPGDIGVQLRHGALDDGRFGCESGLQPVVCLFGWNGILNRSR